MRDPLAWIPVRYKLPLTFAFLCLVAFLLGGYVVTNTVRQSLREQIELRLNERANSINLIVDRSLELLGRRVEDFASDGFIRLQLERLAAGEDRQGTEEARERLVRHLQLNKLPLVDAFADAFLLDADGRLILTAHGSGGSPPRSFDRAASWVGPLERRGEGSPFARFVLSTPVSSIEGGRRLGSLQIVVRADDWINGLEQGLAFPGATGFSAELSSPAGEPLALVTAPAGTAEDADRIHFARTIGPAGWRLDLAVDGDVVTIPVNQLLWKFLYLGVALVALTVGLLLFPQQFLLKPLTALQDAARRLAEGDFSARVESTSTDEVGELAGAFNFMAAAVEERTRKLEKTAETLERRKADIRFERDRLNAVIRSMEDGLFILDTEGRITLSNVAARPVIEALSKPNCRELRLQCRRIEEGPDACLHCISDFANEVQGCVVNVGSQVFEINGAVLSGQREAIAGKVFVSRDVTARIRQSERQAHQERLTVLGEIAAVMAHELNNPLAAISMFSQMLLKGLDTGSGLRSHAEVVYRNTESCKGTIRTLLDMATTTGAEFEEYDIHQLVADVTQLLEPVAHRAGVTVQCGEQSSDPRAFGDELQLRQAIVNLVMNAIQSFETGERGRVVVATADRGGRVAIVVRDNGSGIPVEIREHIFEPFFTTKPPGEGTGLGLSTSRRIVQAQGGALTLLETGPGNTVFEVVVPREPSATLPDPATPPASHDSVASREPVLRAGETR